MGKKTGRPSGYCPEIVTSVCQRIADGLSLRQIAAIEGNPDKATILRWLQQHPEFRDQYARAREMQAEHWADEILEICDDGSNDWMVREGKEGSPATIIADHEHISRSKLRVDSRKWLMSKLAPKKYGDKITQEVTGKDGAPLVPILNVNIGGSKPEPSS